MHATATTQDTALLRTPLYALHVDKGGKMVPFAGYDMPVQYASLGVMKEHLHTREHAGLFDVSHMGQALLRGNGSDPALALERLVPGDIAALGHGKQKYTVLLNEQGGIIDDLMVARLDDTTLLLVVNAACKDNDFAYIAKQLGSAVTLDRMDDRALLALQGPKAESVLAAIIPSVSAMMFMDVITATWDGAPLYISRSGYTGEDGFEISIPAERAEDFARLLLQTPDCALIGLGARDSLRLEAGLCLYGHDITTANTPVDANLKWTIGKRRREEKSFLGADVILGQIASGTPQLRVGITPQGKAPVREGVTLHDDSGAKIGVVTSGGFGPTFGAPVAMGYVDAAHAKNATTIYADVRGQKMPCTVSALPFVPTRYKKG